MSNARIPDINDVKVAGRLARDPELAYLTTGKPYSKSSVCYTSRYKDRDGNKREDTSFFDFTVWGPAAEWVAERLAKGAPVLIEGTLKQESWEDKDGQKRSKVSITANRVHALEWESEEADTKPAQRPAARPTTCSSEPPPPEPYPEDDIPF